MKTCYITDSVHSTVLLFFSKNLFLEKLSTSQLSKLDEISVWRTSIEPDKYIGWEFPKDTNKVDLQKTVERITGFKPEIEEKFPKSYLQTNGYVILKITNDVLGTLTEIQTNVLHLALDAFSIDHKIKNDYCVWKFISGFPVVILQEAIKKLINIKIEIIR